MFHLNGHKNKVVVVVVVVVTTGFCQQAHDSWIKRVKTKL